MARKKKITDKIKDAIAGETEATETQEVQEVQPEVKSAPRAPQGPGTQAATTLDIFRRQMAVLRQSTIPARYNTAQNKRFVYIEPTEGNYQIDPLDINEAKGIEYWVTVLDYATRYPVDITGWTATGVTVTGNGVDFSVTIDDNTAGPKIDSIETANDAGWYVVRAKVDTDSDVIVNFEYAGSGEKIPVAGGSAIYSDPEYDTGKTTIIVPFYIVAGEEGSPLTFSFEGDNGKVINFNDLEFYRLAHNIS
jgi:hypothetical protein